MLYISHVCRFVKNKEGIHSSLLEYSACALRITKEMLEAGATALASYDPSDDAIDAVTSEEAVRAVYVAMVGAQQAGKGKARRSIRRGPTNS